MLWLILLPESKTHRGVNLSPERTFQNTKCYRIKAEQFSILSKQISDPGYANLQKHMDSECHKRRLPLGGGNAHSKIPTPSKKKIPFPKIFTNEVSS